MKKLMIILIAMVATLSMNASSSQTSRTSQNSSRDANSTIDMVKGKTTDVYDVYFRRGQKAEVAVIGDGDTDLDLYVYDENGNLIEFDNDLGDDCYVSWTPRWSGHFKIKIKNLGNQSNCYMLITK